MQIQVLFLAKKFQHHKLNVDMAWQIIMYFMLKSWQIGYYELKRLIWLEHSVQLSRVV